MARLGLGPGGAGDHLPVGGRVTGPPGGGVVTARILIGAAALALVLGACGGDGGGSSNGGSSSGGGGGGEVTLSAVDNSFDPSELSVPSGEVTVEFTNDGQNSHTFSSEQLGFDTGTIEPGDSKTVTFEAPDKATPFQCNIHASSGMTGEITPE
jgi:cytochrome c oxidase subunit II